MAREIKFRGMTRRKGEKVRLDGTPVEGNWVYGGVFATPNDFSVIYTYEPVEKRTVYTDTLGQYTGLKDKNNVEMYDGDIVKDENGNIARILFLQQEMGYVLVYPKYDRRLGHRNRGSAYDCDLNLKVIGNIHENKELLKELI